MKIWENGNYIKVIKDDGTQARDSKSDVRIGQSEEDGIDFTISSPMIGVHNLQIGYITDENDDQYTEQDFEDFADANTGNFSSALGGSKAGFIDYNDTTGAIALLSGVWTNIPNDGLGPFTNKTYKPDDVTELIDVVTGHIDVTETQLGESILIRNDYSVNPSTNNSLLEFRYELGTGGGVYTLEKIVGRLDSGSGQPYRFSLKPDLIYMGDINTRDNPIKMQIRLSTNGTLINAGSVIQLLKR